MTAPARKTATNWRTRIHADTAVLAGKPVINGTRISVEFVLELLAAGWTTEEIVGEYDHITAADVRACLAYAAKTLKDEAPLTPPARTSRR